MSFLISTSYSWSRIIQRSSIITKEAIFLIPWIWNCNCISNLFKTAASIRKPSTTNISITSDCYILYCRTIHNIKRWLKIIMLTIRFVYHTSSIIIEVYIIDHPFTWTVLLIFWFNYSLILCKFRITIPCVLSTVSIFIDRCKVSNVLQCPRRANCCISSKLCTSSHSLTITRITGTWTQTCCSIFNRNKHSLHKFVHLFNIC